MLRSVQRGTLYRSLAERLSLSPLDLRTADVVQRREPIGASHLINDTTRAHYFILRLGKYTLLECRRCRVHDLVDPTDAAAAAESRCSYSETLTTALQHCAPTQWPTDANAIHRLRLATNMVVWTMPTRPSWLRLLMAVVVLVALSLPLVSSTVIKFQQIYYN